MQTRSQTQKQTNHQPLYEVFIDFDEATREWKENKKSIGNGCYRYCCLQKTKQGKPCKREACPGTDYCKIHHP